jgi:hypothetical protein
MTRQFARLPDYINVPLLQDALVVVIGVGMVGSQIAEGLARFAVGRLRLIDHDIYELENTLRHALPVKYARGTSRNKAEAMADYLEGEIEGLRVEAIPRKIDGSVSDDLLASWLGDADLVVAATDDRSAQRRIGQQALISEIAAVFPAVYPHRGGGEVILQLDREWPCFGCWDFFRPDTEALRGERALDLEAQSVIFHAEQLCLGFLDPGSRQHDLLLGEHPGDPPHQLVMLDRAAVPSFGSLTRRLDCPSCGSPIPPPPPPPLPPRSRTPAVFAVAVAVVAAIISIVVAATAGNSSAPSTSNQAQHEVAATETPTPAVTTATEPSTAPSKEGESGTSVATARAITPGAEEEGNSDTVAYGEGSCGPEQGQFWKAMLHQGEEVTIVWGGPEGHAMGLDIWPPGTTDIHGSDERRLTYQSTAGEHNEKTFTAPTTGVYPIVIDDSCGSPGPFHFTLSSEPG